MLVDAHGEVTQDVLVEPLQPFDLVDRGGAGLDIHQGEMRLAVLAQAVGEGFDAPLLDLGAMPPICSITPLNWAVRSSTCWELASWRERKTCSYSGMEMPFPLRCGPLPAKPSEPFRERLES